MKHIVLLTTALVAGSGFAFAQTATRPGTPPPDNAPVTAVPATPPASAGQLVPGANSFTEAQARSRIEKAGYTDVGGLVKSEDGIWHGPARKNGANVTVAVDFKGTITTR